MASGDTLMIFAPQGYEAGGANFAVIHQRNAHPVLDFDAATAESALWSAILPSGYAGGGLTVKVHFAMSSATSGSVIWKGSFEKIAPGVDSIASDGFGAAVTQITAVPGTSGLTAVSPISFLHASEIDGLAVGNAFRFKLMRDAAMAGDTAAGDAEVLVIELLES